MLLSDGKIFTEIEINYFGEDPEKKAEYWERDYYDFTERFFDVGDRNELQDMNEVCFYESKHLFADIQKAVDFCNQNPGYSCDCYNVHSKMDLVRWEKCGENIIYSVCKAFSKDGDIWKNHCGIATEEKGGLFVVYTLEMEKLGIFMPNAGKNEKLRCLLDAGEDPVFFGWEEKGFGKWNFGKDVYDPREKFDIPDNYRIPNTGILEAKLTEQIPKETTPAEWAALWDTVWAAVMGENDRIQKNVFNRTGGIVDLEIDFSAVLGGEAREMFLTVADWRPERYKALFVIELSYYC